MKSVMCDWEPEEPAGTWMVWVTGHTQLFPPVPPPPASPINPALLGSWLCPKRGRVQRQFCYQKLVLCLHLESFTFTNTIIFLFFWGKQCPSVQCLGINTNSLHLIPRTSLRDPTGGVSRGCRCPYWISSIHPHAFRQKWSLELKICNRILNSNLIKSAAYSWQQHWLLCSLLRYRSPWYSLFFT